MADVSLALSKKMEVSLAAFILAWVELGEP